MNDTDLTELDTRVLSALRADFPVSQSPYCDIAAALDALEIDVLNSAEKLRQTGEIARIAALFADFDYAVASDSIEDADLAHLVGVDVPWGEHPYAEVAAQLELRGISLTEAQVIARLQEWLADGTITKVVALTE